MSWPQTNLIKQIWYWLAKSGWKKWKWKERLANKLSPSWSIHLVGKYNPIRVLGAEKLAGVWAYQLRDENQRKNKQICNKHLTFQVCLPCVPWLLHTGWTVSSSSFYTVTSPSSSSILWMKLSPSSGPAWLKTGLAAGQSSTSSSRMATFYHRLPIPTHQTTQPQWRDINWQMRSKKSTEGW